MFTYIIHCLESIEWRRKTDVPQINWIWMQDIEVISIQHLKSVKWRPPTHTHTQRKKERERKLMSPPPPPPPLEINSACKYFLISVLLLCNGLAGGCAIDTQWYYLKKNKKNSHQRQSEAIMRAWNRGPQESRHFSVLYGWGVMRLGYVDPLQLGLFGRATGHA